MKTFLSKSNRINPQPIHEHISVAELIDSTFLAYNAGRLREACQLYAEKITKENVLIGMSLSGALTPAGIGISCLIPLMQNGLVDWIVSTGANLYHDLHFTLAKSLFRGSPHWDDRSLRHEGIIRIYDIVFEYDVLLSTDTFIRTVVTAEEFQKEMGTAELHYLLGKYAAEREKKLTIHNRSILATAFEHGIPVYASSPADSSIGMNIAACTHDKKGLKIDTIRDITETAALVYSAKKQGNKSGMMILGGGSPKNFMLQTEPHIQEILGLNDAGHDYFIQITDARPDTGGLSGATPSEAVSWGKIDPEALPDTVVAYADTTIAFPLLVAYTLAKDSHRKPKRLYDRRADAVALMMEDVKKIQGC